MSIFKNKLIIIFLLLPFLFPGTFFDFFPSIKTIDYIVKFIVCCVILIFYFFGNKVSTFILIVSLYSLILLISIFINRQGAFGQYNQITFLFTRIAICMLLEMCIKASAKIFLEAFTAIYTVLMILNLLFLLMYPEGIIQSFIPNSNLLYYDRCNLLGLDNAYANYFIPYLAAMFLLSLYKSEKITFFSWVMFLVVSVTVILLWSATGVVAWFVILAYMIVIRNTKLNKFVNFKYVFLCSIGLFLIIVVFRMQELFSLVIEDVLGKSITFTGRTEVWDHFITQIGIHPIIGWGDSAQMLPFGIFELNTHNLILEILLHGGILALSLWICLIVVCGRNLTLFRQHKYSSLMSAFLFAYLISGLTEAKYAYNIAYFLFALVYFVPEIINQEQILYPYRNKPYKKEEPSA